MNRSPTERALYTKIMQHREVPASKRKNAFIKQLTTRGMSEWMAHVYFCKFSKTDPIWNDDWHKELRLERLARLELALRVCKKVQNHPTPYTEFTRLLKAQGWGTFSILQAKKRCWQRLPRHLHR